MELVEHLSNSNPLRRRVAQVDRKSTQQKLSRQLLKDLKRGNTKGIDDILHNNANKLNDLDPEGKLLMTATKSMSREAIKILLKHGSLVVGADTENGLSPLHLASKNGAVAILAIMHSYSVDLDQPCLYDKRTAMHIAVKHNRLKIAEFLLENGANVDSKDIYGIAPLHLTISTLTEHESDCQTPPDLLSLLLKYNANINIQDNEGWTPLHYAIKTGNLGTVRKLLGCKANLLAQTKYGKTPLHLACSENNLAMVGLLLDNNAPSDVRDSFGKTPGCYTANKEIHSLLQCSGRYGAEELSSPIHINMQIKSKSLIDLIDPQFLKEDLSWMEAENKVRSMSLSDLIVAKANKDVCLSHGKEKIDFVRDSRCHSIQDMKDGSKRRASTLEYIVEQNEDLDDDVFISPRSLNKEYNIEDIVVHFSVDKNNAKESNALTINSKENETKNYDIENIPLELNAKPQKGDLLQRNGSQWVSIDSDMSTEEISINIEASGTENEFPAPEELIKKQYNIVQKNLDLALSVLQTINQTNNTKQREAKIGTLQDFLTLWKNNTENAQRKMLCDNKNK